MLLMLPPLIAETGLLSFVSRHHVGAGTLLREVALKETTMRRRLSVSWRADSYLLPAALRLIELFASFKDGVLNPKGRSRRAAVQPQRGMRKAPSAA
jgi:hypothetical protein